MRSLHVAAGVALLAAVLAGCGSASGQAAGETVTATNTSNLAWTIAETTPSMSLTLAATDPGPGVASSVSQVSIGATTPPALDVAQDPSSKPLIVAPKPPRLASVPADFTSAAAVAAAYLAVWCYQPINLPANQDLVAETPWVTAAGWADDKTDAVSANEWAQMVKSGLTSVCGPVESVVSAEAPASAKEQWVDVSAMRAYVNAAGKIVGQQKIAETRRVLQDGAGRWLVDVQVQAG